MIKIGNFVNRVVKFINSKYAGVVPTPVQGEGDVKAMDDKFIADVNAGLLDYYTSMESIKICAGVRSVMDISRLGNGYLQVCRHILHF